MKKAKYLFRVISGMHYKEFLKTVGGINKKTGKSKTFLFFDILWCALRYGAGYNDYKIYEFYNMKAKNRNTFVTRVRNKKVIMAFNNQEYSDIFDHKNQFDKRFKKYLRREIIDLKETNLNDFMKFMKDKDTVFAKPYNLDSGRGIEKLNKKDFKKIEKMYDYLKSKNLRMIEEPIKQHKDMSKLYPNAVNCMRIVTLVDNGVPEIVYIVLKTGTGGQFLDNMGFDGLCTPVNVNTGKLMGFAHSEHGKDYEYHPDTKVKFDGYQIPYFKEVINLVKEVAMEVPEIKYVGWDVFIDETGPGLIEGNDYPDYAFWQLPVHNPERIGLMPYFKKKIKNIKKIRK